MENQKDKLLGEVLLIQPVSLKILTALTAISVIAIALFLLYGKYARSVHVKGYLVPTKGVVKIYSSVEGFVHYSNVQEGKIVDSKDVLMEIKQVRGTNQVANIDQNLIDQLKQRQLDFKEIIAANKIKQEALVKKNTEAIQAQKSETQHLKQKKSILQERLNLTKDAYERISRLTNKGYASEKERKTSKEKYIESQLDVQNINLEIDRNEKALTKLLLDREEIPIDGAIRDLSLREQLAEIDTKLLSLKGASSNVIRSYINGRVTALQVKPGEYVSANTLLMVIMPINSLLEAELFLPTSAVGFIEEGQEILIRYQAFPYQRYGTYVGRVKNITSTILRSEEINAPIKPTGPVYRVTASIDKQSIDASEQSLPLQSGMILDADIVLDRLSLWQWLLEPVYKKAGNKR